MSSDTTRTRPEPAGASGTANQDVGCTTGDMCPACGGDDLRPEHAHVKCPSCGYIGPCCW